MGQDTMARTREARSYMSLFILIGLYTGRRKFIDLGKGLIENAREAFRFLIFNYDTGDEIFVFGFSRGAFSARTFIGFIH